MRVPFSFPMTATAKNGLLWGPVGGAATIANAYAPIAPANRRAYVMGYHLETDTANAQCKIGTYDVTGDVFTAKLTVDATQVSGGGVVNPSGPALAVLDLYDSVNTPPHSIVPAIQLITGAILVLVGDLDLQLAGETGEELQTRLAAVVNYLLEEDGTNELEEDNVTTINEEQP